jgi:tetratricopeptide (TPR) repeat protein
MSARNPRDVALLNQLGELNFKLGENDAALDCFRRVLEIEPDNTVSLYLIPGIRLALGDKKTAEEGYRHAVKLQPFYKVPADKTPPDFSVLVIFAPLLGNTPVDGLMIQASYEINIYPLLSGEKYDVEMLKRGGQVLFNAVSDADVTHSVLPLVAELVDRLGMPVINHPAKIQKTTRDGVARLLRDIPHCRMAQIMRHAAGEALPEKIPFSLPFLVRSAGTHGGEEFEKVDSLDELDAFIRQYPDVDHFLMEYIDYQSPDGHFRKFRFIFVEDQILPYHLAIGDRWKVHHITTDMDKNEQMQAEEKAFLENPAAFFPPKLYQAMRAIQQAIGLEYFGVDCGIDRAGNLVVFEANASMIVHWHNEAFPYKTPFVAKIKQAFDDMLKRHAERGRPV